MLTRDQAINCIHRVRRIEMLKRQAESGDKKPPDYELLVIMLRHLKQRERMLLAQLTPEARLEVREEIDQQEMLSNLTHRRNEAKANDD